MKLFCMDLHISVIADFKSACPDVEVVDWCLSAHAWVMKRKQDCPDHINPSTWQHLTPGMIKKFQEKYDDFLRTFDGFIVGYCSAFAMIYEKYNKPIIMLNAVRYDIPFCSTKDTNMLVKWHECLDRLNSHRLITIVSNNKADQLYTLRGCGLQSQYIPSLCLYTNTQYTPSKSTFLLAGGSLPAHPLVSTKSDLPQPHEWSDVTKYRGIINFPYDVSLMSVFEHFTAGCPLFFPSKAYWKAHPHIQSVNAYWGDQLPAYLSEFKNPDTWIDLSDMYGVFQSPNTHYFDSVPHLFELLESFEYVDDSQFRKDHIASVKHQWSRVLQTIVSGAFWDQEPRHMSYNRLPLLANVVFDINYAGTGVQPQHKYPSKSSVSHGDVVFIKTDMLRHVLDTRLFNRPITLVTGVSDISPNPADCDRIINNPRIKKWIGCNITVSHPKIIKMPIGVGEPERPNGNHETLLRLHTERIPWSDKADSVCIPHHSNTYAGRHLEATLPKLDYEEYMRAISRHKFVVCQRGNGLDTHRVCEVLLMGSVPVLEHSGLDDMYDKWTVLIVDSFSSINTSEFVWDDLKYEAFLDTFWLRDALKDRLL
jgi:hypothetical protein